MGCAIIDDQNQRVFFLVNIYFQDVPHYYFNSNRDWIYDSKKLEVIIANSFSKISTNHKKEIKCRLEKFLSKIRDESSIKYLYHTSNMPLTLPYKVVDDNLFLSNSTMNYHDFTKIITMYSKNTKWCPDLINQRKEIYQEEIERYMY